MGKKHTSYPGSTAPGQRKTFTVGKHTLFQLPRETFTVGKHTLFQVPRENIHTVGPRKVTYSSTTVSTTRGGGEAAAGRRAGGRGGRALPLWCPVLLQAASSH